MKFAIRDDDPSAMTRPEELESCWGRVWGEIPVGLSITPFRVPGSMKGVPEEYRGSDEALPLEENRELVSYLRELIAEGKVHIAMHGYHHTNPGGRPEYVGGEDLKEKTLHGRRYLETLLGSEIRTFVPPNNGMSLEGFAAIASARMNVVNAQPYGRMLGIPRNPAALADFFMAAQYALRVRAGLLSPFSVFSYRHFKQVPYQTVGPSTDLRALGEALKNCRSQGGIFILATHYHAFERTLAGGEKVGDVVSGILDTVRADPGVEFQTYDQIWDSSGV